MTEGSCPFCQDLEPFLRRGNTMAIFDRFPVSPGHSLVIPLRHVESYFDLEPAERQEAWELVEEVRLELSERFSPSGFNLGVNIGADAGQTVPHVHLHVIPRYPEDMDDPRGGVRGVIPEKQKYETRAARSQGRN